MSRFFVLLGSIMILAPSFSGDSFPPSPVEIVPAALLERYYDPHPFPWPESSPELQGLESEAFERAFQAAEALPNMYGLVVIRNGMLIAERYFHGQSAFQANHIHSASKSFTSALAGIALRENFLQNLDQKVMDFFPEYASSILDPRTFQITLRHLLTMRAGFAWDDELADFIPYMASPDWALYALTLPLRYDPGNVFHYATPQTNLISAILTKVTGMSTKAFADQYLFGPAGISILHWYQDPKGVYTGGHEMYFSPRDMARFGFLFLRGGRMDNRQIIPADWVIDSWRRTGRSGWNWGPLLDEGYGYQWWMGTLGGYDVFFASGKGGQYIIAVPELDMVVVTTTNADSWTGHWEQSQEVLRVVDRYILQAARSRLGDPPYPPSGLSVRKTANRGLAYREYVNVIRWEPNVGNAGTDIMGYRIYDFFGETRILRGEVPAGTWKFQHRGVDRTRIYHYAVSAVSADGRESLPAYAPSLIPSPVE